MLLRFATAALASATLALLMPETAAARGAGCPELPDYARAQGTLEMGEGACNMTTAEAMRIVRRERPDIYGPEPQPPVPHKKRHHRAAQ